MTLKEYPTPVELDRLKEIEKEPEHRHRSREELEQAFRDDNTALGKIVDLEGNVCDLDETVETTE